MNDKVKLIQELRFWTDINEYKGWFKYFPKWLSSLQCPTMSDIRFDVPYTLVLDFAVWVSLCHTPLDSNEGTIKT